MDNYGTHKTLAINAGSHAIHAFTCTSPRLRPLGSIRSTEHRRRGARRARLQRPRHGTPRRSAPDSRCRARRSDRTSRLEMAAAPSARARAPRRDIHRDEPRLCRHQHRRGEIRADDVIAEPGQRRHVSAGAAADVEARAGSKLAAVPRPGQELLVRRRMIWRGLAED